jgi:glycosyltransferase involved in cell wall biosynthesis
MKVSVIIIAKDEEGVIERCLKSVGWGDEIILIDGGSSDRTIEIAEKYGAKVFFNKWEGFVKQKLFALSKVRNEWIFSLDADEEVSEELADEISKLDFKEEGYRIKRENYFLGKKIKYCGWDKDYQLRLFNGNHTQLKERLVHEGFSVEGSTGVIEAPIRHFTTTSIEKTFNKINSYSTLQSLEQVDQKGKITPTTVISHTLSAFLRTWISLKGYKEGMHGVIIASMDAATTMLTYTKIWELKRNRNR